jgi:hypothetical protein
MTPHLQSARRLLIALALLGGVFATVGLAPSPAVAASPTKTTSCRISGSDESLGPTYVLHLEVGGGPSCAAGKALIRAYYRCRIKQGGVSGHCSGVEGFHCTEHRYAVIAVQFDARVTCSRGRQRIVHDYTQFT